MAIFKTYFKVIFLLITKEQVRRGLGKISNPQQSRLYTGGPSSQPAAT